MDPDSVDESELISWLDSQCRPRGPRAKKIGSVMRNYMVKRGLSSEKTQSDLEQAWRTVVGPQLTGYCRVGKLSRSVLHVTVDNNLVLQELQFSKMKYLVQLAEVLPDYKIRDIRFSVRR